MLRLTTWIWGILALLVGSVWILILCFSLPSPSSFTKEEPKAFQEKQGVTKELFLSHKGKPSTHYLLSSATSLLALSQKEKKCSLVEKLTDCQWISKEGLCIQAKQGEFSEEEHSFKAEEIALRQGEQTAGAKHLSYRGELLLLEENVSLSSLDLGKAKCKRAELSPNRNEGLLVGNVKLARNVIDRQGSSHTMDLSCPKLSFTDKEVEVPSETEIAWDNSLFFSGGRSLFHKNGIVYLFPSETTKKCLCKGPLGTISAENLSLDLEKQLAHFLHPKGAAKKLDLSFHAHHLYFFEETKEAILEGDAFLLAPLLGTLNADKRMHLFFAEEKLSTEGPSYLTTIRGETLSCSGSSLIDQKKGTLEMRGKPLRYSSPTYELEAESFSGTFNADPFTPLDFSMEGNLSFLDKSSDQLLRCALAEKAVYDSKEELLILSASPPSAVLFWDKNENIRLRAPEIHISNGKGKERVEAKGVASLTLSPEEQTLLETRFFTRNSF